MASSLAAQPDDYPNVIELSRKDDGSPKVIEISRGDDEKAKKYLRKYMAYDETIEEIRPRFEEILNLLQDVGRKLEADGSDLDKELIEELKGIGINKHDLSHQLRTTFNVVNFMLSMGSEHFSHREIVVAGAAAIMHDVAYNKLRPENMKQPDDVKEGFHNHAADGADEIKEKLTRMVAIIQRRPNGKTEMISKIRKLITYKNENGEDVLLTEEDIDLIWGSIFHHNDYGKEEVGYNPHMVKKPELAVQLADKLDITQQRVYSNHMIPEDFVPTGERKDGTERKDNYVHRAVPYCILDYKFIINKTNARMTWVANVDLGRMNELMGYEFYNPESFREDFNKAYEGSSRVAAEAFGAILHKFDPEKSIKDQTSHLDGHNPLKVELRFKDGTIKKLYYKRPERDIYTNSTIAPWKEELSAKRAEIMRLVKRKEG